MFIENKRKAEKNLLICTTKIYVLYALSSLEVKKQHKKALQYKKVSTYVFAQYITQWDPDPEWGFYSDINNNSRSYTCTLKGRIWP